MRPQGQGVREIVEAAQALQAALDATQRLAEGPTTAKLRFVIDGNARLKSLADIFLNSLTAALRYVCL